MTSSHITALVTLADDVPEPKSSGVRSGYEAHHKFAQVDYLAGGFHRYADDALHFPGETLLTTITFPSWEHFGSSIRVGDAFEIFEHRRLVGTGVVQSIEG